MNQNHRLSLGKVLIHFAANQKFTPKWCEKIQNLQNSSTKMVNKTGETRKWSWLRLKPWFAMQQILEGIYERKLLIFQLDSWKNLKYAH